MRTEHWIKSWCPECKATNWVLDSDSVDLTIPDIEAVRCWSCQLNYWLDEEFSEEYHRAAGDIGYINSDYKNLAQLLASEPNCLMLGAKEPMI